MPKKVRKSQKYNQAKSDLKVEKEYNEKLIVAVAEWTAMVNSERDKELKAIRENELSDYEAKLRRSNKRLPMYQERFDEVELAEEFGLNIKLGDHSGEVLIFALAHQSGRIFVWDGSTCVVRENGTQIVSGDEDDPFNHQ